MRDVFRLLPEALGAFRERGISRADAEQLCLVELGLLVAHTVDPEISVSDAWPLFSGYPFARARGLVTAEGEAMLQIARYALWNLGRPRAWEDALDQYEGSPPGLNAYGWSSRSDVARRAVVTVAPDRWTEYAEVLRAAPPFAGSPGVVATKGAHRFFAGRSPITVELPEVSSDAVHGHLLDVPLSGAGEPLTIAWVELEEAAREMDQLAPRNREGILESTRLFAARPGGLELAESFTVNQTEHLLGMVGAGKSTVRDVLTYHLVKNRNRRVTIVVGDVAEVLKLVGLFRSLGCTAAPIIGASYREQHAQRLHRRLASRGQTNLLSHDDNAFDYLSTACAISGLIDDEHAPLEYADAPCSRLNPVRQRGTRDRDQAPYKQERRICPFWNRCPRHRGSRDLVDADIWIATPPSLVDTAVPWPQNAERLRYLELAARRSDLIIVDEADRVQTQLDRMFAPAISLAGEATTSWLDEVAQHKITELVDGQRTQLSNRDVANWTTALNTASMVTDRLYAMLVSSRTLRKWVSGSYFNAWSLHGKLVELLLPSADRDDQPTADREELLRVLEEYRRDPFGERGPAGPKARTLVELTNQLLHTSRSKATRARMHRALMDLLPAALCTGNPDDLADKFELTLLLAALEPKLALMTGMWPRVQVALNLGFNQLHRRPVDYGPMVPESPMGNILGFEFLLDGPDEGGIRSGELRFFRCSGVGRSLLASVPRLAEVEGRPGAHVLLMSGSSWAGTSSRYHVLTPVGLVLKPPPDKVERISTETTIRLECVWQNGKPLTLSGARLEERPAVLRTMALALATPDDDRRSRFELELADLAEHRRHLLVLTGSYSEAKVVADAIHSTSLKGRVVRLLADDQRDPVCDEAFAPTLRRGDLERLPRTQAWILVAPLLAVERGHNIMADGGEAAIGTVYFLARPNPRPDDLSLAVQAINDWISRAIEDPVDGFGDWVSNADGLGVAGREVRSRGYREWFRLLSRSLAWSRLTDGDRPAVTWDLLVLMWQVIGRLVRGGVGARVVLVDAAFAPGTAAALAKDPLSTDPVLITDHDTARSSLLVSIHDLLGEYLFPSRKGLDSELTQALYEPLWQAADRCIKQPTCGGKSW